MTSASIEWVQCTCGGDLPLVDGDNDHALLPRGAHGGECPRRRSAAGLCGIYPPKKRSPGKATGATQRKATHGVHGNRGTVWPPEWLALSDAYGGNGKLVEEIGITYNTAYRWVVKGEAIPAGMIKLIGFLAASKGLANPAAP